MVDRQYHYLPWEDYLHVAAGAGKKVDPDGTLLPYYGNTVIYDLLDNTKDALVQLQEKLYESCGHFLSEKLTRESFHMTLHDLVSGTDREAVLERVNAISEEAKQTAEKARGVVGNSMPMRPVKLVSMVSTSVVLLLEPVYPVDRALLDMAYGMLQSVVPLNYGLTPHVTLAYYRPGTIAGADLQILADTLSELSENLQFDVVLKYNKLHYREFYDMNHYVEGI